MFLSTNLKYLRVRNNLQQKELGKALDITDRQVRQYENGELKNPNLALLIKFADYFNVSLDELIRIDLSNK